MAYPEKSTVGTKQNRRPVTDPDGQLSANEINEIVSKLNKNALFHGVHQSLSILQATFPNPEIGAFAYLDTGEHYRCINIGWTSKDTNSSGVSYFKGYHLSIEALRIAHPEGTPGDRAIIKVEGANDKEALWDDDAADWFEFSVQSISQQYIDDQDAATLQAANEYAASLLGGTVQPTRLNSFILGYDSGLTFDPSASFTIDGIDKTDAQQDVTLAPVDPANPTFKRIDTFCINLQTEQIEVIPGIAAENPTEPEIDFSLYLKGPFVLISAGEAAPDGFDILNVYQENLGTAGGEFNAAGGSDFDFANEEDPAKGIKAIKAVGDISINQTLPLSAGADIPIESGKELSLQIKNITPGDFYVRLTGKRRGGRTETFRLPDPKDHGYDPNNLTDYQRIILPVDQNILQSFNKVNITSQNNTWRFFIDDIYFTGGSGVETGSPGSYVTKQEFNEKNAEQDDKINFTATLDQYGLHPAFNSLKEAVIWLLGNSGGSGGNSIKLNAPSLMSAQNLKADEIKLTWLDTNI